ncbi:TetR family transcriptional regulator [Jiella pacifica]|uniref:TetR family transcriptional regulator n=1 Tax=Jiella pacifica TaxID=2696469 RepID=A0A6N9T029_9HYPH|nr:TetR family transcriptional regulator [Jiella pacifica]NDW03555.1 TetR family transcriptional regulator [Jiella pacifica]
MSLSHERLQQKSRTREAVLAGARALIARGEAVTVAAAAAEVGVSKATAYRYFSDPNTLAAEAGLALDVRPYEAIVVHSSKLREKLLAIGLEMFDLALGHEAEFRRFLARNLDASGQNDRRQAPPRGARRTAMYRRALDETPHDLTEEEQARLVRALSVATGVEAMISLLDVAQASREEARATVQEVAEAILDKYLPTKKP